MKKLVLLLFIVLFQGAFAQNFDFSSSGQKDANNILKNFIEQEFDIDNITAIAYFYDNKVIGIVKHNIFYTLEGYKLIVLKEEEGGFKPVKCDVLFDNTEEFSINDNKINFYKSIFYKNKKYSAYIKPDEIKTHKSINDKLTDRKVKDIEAFVSHKRNESINVIELKDFKTSPERNVNIRYNNLNTKVKHYVEMR